ncbi:hypothetical protein ACER0C_019880 [Sarotherodon galilaeus]
MELLLLFLSFCFLTLSGLTFEPTVVVKEGDSAILPCSLNTNVNIESALFDWKKVEQHSNKEVFLYDKADVYSNGRPGQVEQFKGRVSHFPEELEHGNASIRIENTKVADSGNYTCEFPRIQPEKIFHIELIVGAAPEPVVSILDGKGLLECRVKGAFPKPTVEWWDSSNKTVPSDKKEISEREHRFYITLQTTVSNTGRYRCVTTQEEIHHQISTDTFVALNEQTVIVKEGDDAILSCSLKTRESIESKPFSWTKEGPAGQKKVFLYDTSNNDLTGQDKQFKGRVSNFPEGLKHGDASITIKNTKVTDTGKYICSFSHLQPKRNAEILLLVDALSGTGMIKATVLSVICGMIGFFVAV